MYSSQSGEPTRIVPEFLSGGGETAAAIRAHDWSASPLGDPAGWPQALRTILGLMMDSRFPMFVAWGSRLTFLYNDAYRPILGRKHPRALGAPFHQVWSEIWDDIRPLVDRALAGEATWSENLHLTMERRGYPEDTWYTFSYSPVRDDSGVIAGMFCTCTETTGEVLAAAALRESEDHYRHAVELNPQVAWTAAVDGQLDQVAQRWFDWTGMTGLGETWAQALHPEDVGPTFEAWRRSIATGVPYDIEHRVRLRSGEYRWARSRAFPRRADDGSILKWYGATEDVHERKIFEAALRESEQRFRTMSDNAPVMIWTTDASGSCTYLNRRWYEFTGQSEAEGLGLGWTDATHPEDQQSATETFLAANASRAPFRIEYRLRRADGEYAYALDAAEPRFDQDGTWLGYIGSVIDITERQQAEKISLRREESLRSLANAVPAFVWFADIEGSLHYLNDRWYEYTGQTVTEALPHGWVDTVHPDDREHTAEKWQEARTRGILYEVELRYRRHDGEYRWYLTRAEPMRDDTGRVVRWFGTGIDLDDQKRAEQHQQLLINELNHRVKNTLATVQAIASQSFRTGEDVAVGKTAFTARIRALAQAHDLLTRESWEGAHLSDVVEGAIEAFQHRDRNRFTIEGPRARLAPRTAVAFTLALHELATNAAKYGALSNDVGRVVITWSLSGDVPAILRMRWEETAGPPVTPPSRKGFGSRLIETGLAAELRGDVRLAYEPGGLVCTISAPLEFMAD